jgi:hypothetical protein
MNYCPNTPHFVRLCSDPDGVPMVVHYCEPTDAEAIESAYAKYGAPVFSHASGDIFEVNVERHQHAE